jgi:hypothetical protein
LIHKLKVVFKELNETTIWGLELTAQAALLSAEALVAIIAEKPRTLSHYRRFYPDCPRLSIVGRMMLDESHTGSASASAQH